MHVASPGPEWDELNDNPPRFTPISLDERPLNDDGRQRVVGESYYQQALVKVAAGRTYNGDFVSHLVVKVVLAPEPDNPWDGNAVRVDVVLGDSSVKVGYIPAEDARQYQVRLLALRAEGMVGTCPGRICGGGRDRYYGVYLHLARAQEMLGSTEYATEDLTSVTLCSRWNCTVTGEQDHQDVLQTFVPSTGSEAPLTATLDFCTIIKGKYAGERAIEVQLGGRRVGQLTRAMTERYELLVDKVHESGRVALCDAWISSTSKGLEVGLGMPAIRKRS